MTLHIAGELEIDTERGVIRFHSITNGSTILRICRLPTIPEDVESIDITAPELVSILRKRK